MAVLAKVSIVLLLLVQAYSCAALRNQQTAWVTTHLHRRTSSEVRTENRRIRRVLGEATERADETRVSKGLRGSLIRSTYKVETEKLTTFEKIRHDVKMSKNRAAYLIGRVRKTINDPINNKRRLLEDFVSDLKIVPGEYAMQISIGTPPQTFIGVADTGSDLVWVQCSQCNPCFKSSANFDPSLSSTYQLVGCGASCDILGSSQVTCNPNCQYTYRYGDNTMTAGDFSAETLTITDGAGVNVSLRGNFLFGCGLQNAVLETEINGIVGLGRGPISFPSQIAPLLDNNNKFSYCFVLNTHENDASPILFGENAVPMGKISTTPLSSPVGSSFYYVNLNGISVGGSSLSIPSTSFQINPKTGAGGVIFDSGTTATVLEAVAYQLVISAFNSSASTKYKFVDMAALTGLDLCYTVPTFDNLVIPKLTFNFKGADFDMPGENVVQAVDDDAGNHFICLFLTEGPAGSMSIIGNWQQQNFQVLYDLDNNAIGWVQTDCSKL